MKKLTRKNLNALATVMPVLSENEQREYIGGALYVDSGGGILGWDGTSYEMIVTDTLPSGYMDNPQQSGNFVEQSDSIKKSIISGIADSLGVGTKQGLENVDIEFVYMDDFNTNATARYEFINNKEGERELSSGTLKINMNGTRLRTSNNIFDFELLIQHEIHHFLTPEDHSTNKSEYEAYKYMLLQQGANSCSQDYYEHIYMKYLEFRDSLSTEGLLEENDTLLKKKVFNAPPE